MRRLILASGSPRRKELLAALVADFDVQVSNAPEEPVTGDPVEGATRLALRKARVVAEEHPGEIVIGADTVVHDGTRDLGKPANATEAAAMLRALRGRKHRVVTGVAVISDGRERTTASVARVELATLDDEVIAAYVESGRPLDKAGAYAIQDEDVPTVEAYSGCYCAVMGLPLWSLRGLLDDAGIATTDPGVCFARCATCPDRPS